MSQLTVCDHYLGTADDQTDIREAVGEVLVHVCEITPAHGMAFQFEPEDLQARWTLVSITTRVHENPIIFAKREVVQSTTAKCT